VRGRGGTRAAWMVAGLLASAAPAHEPAELLRGIRASGLAPDDALSVAGVEIGLGPALLEIERGSLFPVSPVAGRTLEWIFVGQARFRLEPPDAIEAGQLELFTGERFLETPVEEAVLVLADPRWLSALPSRTAPAGVSPELRERAESVQRAWLARTERRQAGIESALFKCLAGDPPFQQYFALWVDSRELGPFLYHLDPDQQEPVKLSSFRPLALSPWEKARKKHDLKVQQRKGRWLNLRAEDLGQWDVWLSMAWKPARGPALPGNVGFEAEHYALEATLKRRSLALDGRARLDLVAGADGRRVVGLRLMPDLEVRSVADPGGRDLFFFRSADEIVVHLPEPPPPGTRLSLDVTFGGRALEWAGRKSYDLLDTSRWYPHGGTLDRATYDVTLRWPRRLDLLASGKLVERGRRGKYLWERRTLDLPAIAFSFALGDYLVERARSGDTEITLAFSRASGVRIPPRLLQETLGSISGALEYFESAFGDYPLEELTVVTVPRSFSQSYLGFITLADPLARFVDPLGASATWIRDTTIAHELAHQWWGNTVGSWSYRDQWLSEGMANYSALLYESKKSGAHDRLALMSSGWRDSLARTTVEGRTIESLGPVVLGQRLNSSRAHSGYRSVVYRKGAVVLAMLARAVGEECFLRTLRSLAGTARNQVVTTESFLESLERTCAIDLGGFARQYVYGTGIPEVYYGYEFERADSGEWTVRGRARLQLAGDQHYEIVREDGGWDVRRRPAPRPASGATALMVPYRVILDPATQGQDGQLVIEGRDDLFHVETHGRPLEFRLDPRGEILARFFSAQRHPKRFVHHQAEDLAAAGDLAAAEARYLEALLSPPGIDPGAGGDRAGRIQDLKIRLGLTRLYLSQGRIGEAEARLQQVEFELDEWDRGALRVQREALRSRMEILRGEYDPAYRRLKKTLRLASPRRARVPWRNLMLQVQLNTERDAVTEAYSLLAVAAHEVGDAEVFDWALREARDRGVEVSDLEREAGAGRRAAGATRSSDGDPAAVSKR